MKILSPSILSTDFGNLDRTIDMLNRSEAQWIHVDVMDGVFVPNISFGFPILKAVRKATNKPLDTHLMISNPDKYIERFAEEGANSLTVHPETVADIHATIALIKSLGMKAAVSVKPKVPIEEVFPLLPELDMVLIMGVEPGFGGQAFIEKSIDKVVALRGEIDRRGLKTLIEIDGGITMDNIHTMYAKGCDAVVAGNAVFMTDNPIATIHDLLNA